MLKCECATLLALFLPKSLSNKTTMSLTFNFIIEFLNCCVCQQVAVTFHF